MDTGHSGVGTNMSISVVTSFGGSVGLSLLEGQDMSSCLDALEATLSIRCH